VTKEERRKGGVRELQPIQSKNTRIPKPRLSLTGQDPSISLVKLREAVRKAKIKLTVIVLSHGYNLPKHSSPLPASKSAPATQTP
jgi:hypothetical protein